MKRKRSATFSIPNPCNMKWEEMNPVDENKKHCSSCDRVIVDFTKMSDGELLNYFRKNKNACGQFAPHQLNREIFSDVERKNYSGWKNIFILPSLLFGIETFAQQKATDKNFEKQIVFAPSKNFREKEIVPENKKVAGDDSIVIQGIVRDSLSGEPISGAVITFQTFASPFAHCISDSTGHYEKRINISTQDTLEMDVQKSGYQMLDGKLLIANEKKVYEMNLDLTIMKVSPMQLMVCGGVSSVTNYKWDQHPTRHRIHRFFHRIFHPFE